MQKLVVVDYGMGNLHSVEKALNHVTDSNTKIIVSGKLDDLKMADKVLLPGQGAIAGCFDSIRKYNLYDEIKNSIKTKPCLAICIGPQLLMEYSEENDGVDGFGVFKGNCKKFPDSLLTQTPRLKIPHMGWNSVKQIKKHKLWDKIPDSSFFYFVHSYYLDPANKNIIYGLSNYGKDFPCVIARDNIFATQFHPEKSSDVGLQLFKNFIEWSV